MEKVYYYVANVRGYNAINQYGVDFIVKASSTKQAIDVVYKQVCDEHPPEEQKSHGYEPYYKKDIKVKRVDKLEYDKHGLVDTFAIF